MRQPVVARLGQRRFTHVGRHGGVDMNVFYRSFDVIAAKVVLLEPQG